MVAVRYCPKTQRIFGASQNIIKVKIHLERLRRKRTICWIWWLQKNVSNRTGEHRVLRIYNWSLLALQVWDIRDGKCIRSLTPQGSSLGSFLSSMTSETQINDLKLSADGSLLFSAMGNTVRIWDLDRWVMRTAYRQHQQADHMFNKASIFSRLFLFKFLSFLFTFVRGWKVQFSTRFCAARVWRTTEITSVKVVYFLLSNACIYTDFKILKHVKLIYWFQHSSQDTRKHSITHKFNYFCELNFKWCFRFGFSEFFYCFSIFFVCFSLYRKIRC